MGGEELEHYSMRLTPSLRAFLSNILDYAGLFPPANLPLDQAIRNYAEYRSSPEAWTLSRFICPAARLAELGNTASLFSEDLMLAVSALGRASQSAEDFLFGLQESLHRIAAFSEAHPSRVSVEMIELPLPPHLQSPDTLISAAELIETVGPPRLTPFYEAALKQDWQQAVITAVDAIAAHNARWTGQRCQSAGFKLRTGGVIADAFPAPDQVAFVIVTCCERGVALKCTAGLHHPIRRYDASVQTEMHGFLNVFAAGILAHARSLNVSEVQAILEDEQAAHLQFDEDGFAWNGVRATTQEITAARQTAILSFGSCSFDEPCDDLRALGLL